MSCFGIETMIATGLGRALGVPDELTWLETGEVAIQARSTLGQRQPRQPASTPALTPKRVMADRG
jgi:hypothetical protein